jgi:hypothetical protein
MLEKKKRKNQIIIGLILVGIMILSTAGFAVNNMTRSKEETFLYKGFEFLRVPAGWQLANKPFTLITRFFPKDVENVSLLGRWFVDDFSNKEVYFVAYSDEAKIAALEIARNLPFKRVQYACFEDAADLSVCYDLPIKDCFDNVIFINYTSSKKEIKNKNETELTKEGKEIEPKIYQKDNCVIIEAEYSDLVRAADRFLFSIYGII